jgi:hypothetical protein
LKPFYEGWMTKLTASVELAEPIYEEWACNMSSQWHKTKALTGRQPSTKRKKNRFAFLSLIFYFLYFTLFLSFSYIPFLLFQHWGQCRVLSVGVLGECWFSNFGFLCYFSKKKLCLIFWTSIGFWEYEYYVWELVEIDEDINQMKECACKF